jgi:hypothetical protein
MVLPDCKEDRVDSIIQVTQTLRSPTDLQDFRNWLLDQEPSKKEKSESQLGPTKSDKWIGFGDRFH